MFVFCLCFRNIAGGGRRFVGSQGLEVSAQGFLGPVVASGVASLEKDYVTTFRFDRSLTMQSAQHRVHVVQVGGMASSPGMLLTDRFVQDPAPVAVPRRKIVVDGPGQDSRIRFDALAVDGLQNGDVSLLARLALAPCRHRIRNEAGSRHEWNLLPVDAPSLEEIGGGGRVVCGVVVVVILQKWLRTLLAKNVKEAWSRLSILQGVRLSHCGAGSC